MALGKLYSPDCPCVSSLWRNQPLLLANHSALQRAGAGMEAENLDAPLRDSCRLWNPHLYSPSLQFKTKVQ